MIQTSDLRRLTRAIVRSIQQISEDEYAEGAAAREALINFAGQHDLDVQDTATLFRVASGEIS